MNHNTKKTKAELVDIINDLEGKLGKRPAEPEETDVELVKVCLPTSDAPRSKIFTSQGVVKANIELMIPAEEAQRYFDEGALVEVVDHGDSNQAEIPAPRREDIQPAGGHQPPANPGGKPDGEERAGLEAEGGPGADGAEHPVSGLPGAMQEESSAQGGGSEGVGEIPTLPGESALPSD